MSRELLRQSGRAAASDTKTVKIHRFEVPAGVEALTLGFDYGPRVSTNRAENLPLLEAAFELHTRRRREVLPPEEIARHREALKVDARAGSLDNLMNVVLIDAEGRWRGRWDRNPSSDAGALTLSKEYASKGFLPGEIGPGTWTAAIECHGIFGDDVSYEVVVATCPVPAPRVEPPPPQETFPPRRRGPGWYFGEMHSHTLHSDGKWELVGLAAHARRVGCDFLCLTDHNTVSGVLDPGELPITLVPGMELTTFHGHHPMYGIKAMIPWHRDGRVLPLRETGKVAREMGGIVGVAHPFVPGDPLCTGCRMVEGLDPTSFDLMEVWYRRWDSPGTDNEAAYALWNRYWREGHRITAVAARDWHGPEQDGPFPGPLPFTGVYAEDNTPEAILEGIRRGRVILSGGPILDLSITDRLRVRIEKLEEPAKLRVFRSGEVMLETDAKDLEIDVPGPGYYRAELWAPDRPRVIGNHVVVT
jgi:hypothetical protein